MSTSINEDITMLYPPTLNDVCRMLKQLDDIPRPYGDNEGYPVNSDAVYYSLYPEHQEFVNNLLEILYSYTRLPAGQEVNVRSVNYLTGRGYPTYLGVDQYDAYRLVGSVTTENWLIDISDASSHQIED
ncbi:hypothetical protein K5D44_00075 [Pseudomonas cichorii]|nr:hypothetical protein [Pseudomonas cichorii]MBX8563094.1 hypothetical protein [Pseudomonas cichorii]